MGAKQTNWLIDCTDKAIEKSPKETYTLTDSEGRPVAFVKMGNLDPTPEEFTIQQGEANVKLIAAAPLMLDQLKRCYLFMQERAQGSIGFSIITDSLRAALRNNIANAEGRSSQEVQEEFEEKARQQADEY